MDKLLIILSLIIVILYSLTLTWMIRIYNLKKCILDIPNERSSHSEATPRGGGAGFAFIILGGTVLLGLGGFLDSSLVIALAGGGSIVAGIGLWDDIYNLSARIRIFFHFLAALWALYWLGGLTELNLGLGTLNLGWFGTLFAAAGITWMINLYNFMDGIDGLAASEAISVLIAVSCFSLLSGSQNMALYYAFLACAAAGFLLLNWPPAQIFMGDTGSGFLGIMFAILAIAAERSGGVPLLIWLLILGVFIIDATVTLVSRWHQGLKWYEAHRSHVYQLAVQSGFTHKQVTLGLLFINCALFLLAYLLLRLPLLMLPLSLTAALLLMITHRYLNKLFSSKLPADSYSSASFSSPDLSA